MGLMDQYDNALKKLKRDRRSYNELERVTGVPAETIRDITNGSVTDPRISTVRKLVRLYQAAN